MEGVDPVLNSMPVILAQSIHVLPDCEEVSLPGLKRGIDAH
jgi:hypothetical protein